MQLEEPLSTFPRIFTIAIKMLLPRIRQMLKTLRFSILFLNSVHVSYIGI